MNIIINGIEPQFKVYKISEKIENKFYIGKTKQPLKERIKQHKSARTIANKHFSNIGWDITTVEIIDYANDDWMLCVKEAEQIQKGYRENKNNILNINSTNWEGWYFTPQEFKQLYKHYFD